MHRKLIILLLMLGFTPGLVAQSTNQLTLGECIRRAEENSFKLKSDDYAIVAAENGASMAESYALPRISGELGMENRFLQPYYFNQLWGSVHADWSLGDLLRKTGQSSLQDIETRRWEKEQHRLSVIGRSSSLFMSILQVDRQKTILGVRVKFLKHHLQVSGGMWEAGLRSQLDMLQTESEIVGLQEDSAKLVMVRDDLSTELVQLMGGDQTEDLRLAPLQLESMAAKAVPEISLQNLSQNPALSAFDSRMSAQQLRTDEIGAEQIPHINMGSGYMVDADPTGDGNYWLINAGVVIPIYSGKFYEYQKRGSQALFESLTAQRSEAERELVIHLIKLHDRLENTKRLMEIQHQRLAITARAVEFAEVNYEAGIASNLDYISLQQRLTNTELEIEETRLEYVMNLIEFYITNNQVDQILSMGSDLNGK